MPATLPVSATVLSFAVRRKASILSGSSYDPIVVVIWSMAMLAISLLAIRHGLSIEVFNAAFQ